MADMIPYMRLYPTDYHRDTGHLSTVQHGAYLLLLMEYWNRRAPLPDDDHKLARITRLTIREWRRNRPDLEPYFIVQDGTWTQSRVERELEFVRSKSLKAKKAGEASVEAKRNKRSEKNEHAANDDKMSDVKEGGSSSSGEEEEHTSARDGAHRVLAAWNEMAAEVGLSTAPTMTAKRASSLKARLGEHKEAAIIRAIKAVPQSAFLMGKGSSRDGRKPWRANLDDLLRPQNMAKLVDGSYHTAAEMKAATAPPRAPRPPQDTSWMTPVKQVGDA